MMNSGYDCKQYWVRSQQDVIFALMRLTTLPHTTQVQQLAAIAHAIERQ